MGRPRKQEQERRDRKLVLWVSDREHARYLINAASANQTAPDYARALLCHPTASSRASGSSFARREYAFATVDALNRLGATLDQILHIAHRTGHLTEELNDVARAIDDLLDQLLPP